MADDDPVATILKRSPLSNKQRADMWDAYQESASPEDFAERVKAMPVVSGTIKADLFDLKAGQTPTGQTSGGDLVLDNVRNMAGKAVDYLPAIGGAVGGLLGAGAGTVFGMGVGAVPGGIGGATLGGAAGEAAKQLINETVRGRAVPTPSQAAQDIALQGGIQGAAEGLGLGTGALLKPTAESLMHSALKPGVKFSVRALKAGEETPPVVKTLLDEGINVTQGGIAKLNRIIGATNAEIKDAIANIPFEVNPYKVASRLRKTAGEFASQVNPEADLTAISRSGQQFLRNNPGMIPGAEAQAMKTGTYKALGDKAYTGELKGAEVEAQKSLARGLKDEIADEVGATLQGIKGKLGLPGGVDIGALNAREGKALDALDALARRVAVGGNNNPAGIAALAIQHPITFITALMDRSPVVKSMLARGLYSSAAKAAGVPQQLIRSAVAAIASSDDTTEGQP